MTAAAPGRSLTSTGAENVAALSLLIPLSTGASRPRFAPKVAP